ncbi:Major Facilitator Superfamily protein [Halopenitus malekzadehii]|uniref:Major Facilitator Superfamily protein n=1 Tax=Halopenitus malekzadehii TaxID=1267564 RepID=A0A1H6HUX0_9EURY|nr:MFS transporter [Halopenitus malekzadehii]SEH37923.1 Major Facilitator Superfamily protein [Halopenitus malekzadehii]
MSVGHDDLQFGSLYLTRFAASFGFMTVMTLLPTYIETLGATGVTIGVFVAILELARTVGIVPLGWAGDRYSKRSVLLVALGVSVAAYLAFARVASIEGFLVARTLQGLGLTGTGLLSLALVGDLAPPGQRGARIGRYNAFRMGAGIAGTIGAGALHAVAGFDVLFGLLTVILIVATIGVWRFVDADKTHVSGFAFADLAMNERIVTFATFRAQYAVAVTLVRRWVPIFVGVSAAQGGLGYGAVIVGAVLAAEKCTNMVCQPMAGRFSDRQGRAVFILVGGGAYGLVAIAFPFVGGFVDGVALVVPGLGPLSTAVIAAIILNGLLGVADAFREPASMAFFADEGSGEGITSSFGIRSLIWKPGSVLAPLAGGWLMGEFGIEWVFVAGGAAAFAATGTFLGLLVWRYGTQAVREW